MSSPSTAVRPTEAARQSLISRMLLGSLMLSTPDPRRCAGTGLTSATSGVGDRGQLGRLDRRLGGQQLRCRPGSFADGSTPCLTALSGRNTMVAINHDADDQVLVEHELLQQERGTVNRTGPQDRARNAAQPRGSHDEHHHGLLDVEVSGEGVEDECGVDHADDAGDDGTGGEGKQPVLKVLTPMARAASSSSGSRPRLGRPGVAPAKHAVAVSRQEADEDPVVHPEVRNRATEADWSHVEGIDPGGSHGSPVRLRPSGPNW